MGVYRVGKGKEKTVQNKAEFGRMVEKRQI